MVVVHKYVFAQRFTNILNRNERVQYVQNPSFGSSANYTDKQECFAQKYSSLDFHINSHN